MSSVNTLEASHFYYYGKPANEIPNTPFPLGHRITTQFPGDVAKIRIVMTLALTAIVVLSDTGFTIWSWPIVILGLSFAAYTAYKHLLTPDPLVDLFYRIAGGEVGYNNLPVIPIDRARKTWMTFWAIRWQELKHPVYRFTTIDGRKGMLIKGLSYSEECIDLETADQTSPLLRTQAKLIFIEKLKSRDIRSDRIQWPGQGHPALESISDWSWETSFLNGSSGDITSMYTLQYFSRIYGFMTTDMANEFIAQKGAQNRIPS